MARQIELERRAMAQLGINLELSTRLTGKTKGLAQTQACALTDRLGGEEGLEHTRLDFGCHAHAVVCHRQDHVVR